MPDTAFALIGEAGDKLSSLAYNALRDMIVYGELGPGERLYPAEIADKFNISVTPVKEAFTRLHTEGYLVAVPRRGYTVTVPTPRRITELWQVRIGLEVTAGELTIERLRAGSLDHTDLRELDDALSRLAIEGSTDHRKHIELNADFHRLLVSLSDNEALFGLYESIAYRTVGAWVQTGLTSWRERLATEEAEHARVMLALRNLDPDAFRIAIKQHLQRSLFDALTDTAQRGEHTEGRSSRHELA